LHFSYRYAWNPSSSIEVLLDVGSVPQAMHKINTTPYLITGLLTDITKAPAMQVPDVALFPLSRAYRKKKGKKASIVRYKGMTKSTFAVIHRGEYLAPKTGQV